MSFFGCEQLLQGLRRKVYFHFIVTGDEKWIPYSVRERNNIFGTLRLRLYIVSAGSNIYAAKVCCVFGGFKPAIFLIHATSVVSVQSGFGRNCYTSSYRADTVTTKGK